MRARRGTSACAALEAAKSIFVECFDGLPLSGMWCSHLASCCVDLKVHFYGSGLKLPHSTMNLFARWLGFRCDRAAQPNSRAAVLATP